MLSITLKEPFKVTQRTENTNKVTNVLHKHIFITREKTRIGRKT